MFLVRKDRKLWKNLSQFFSPFWPHKWEQLPDTLQNCSSQKALLTGSVTLTHKPAIITFLHDINNVTIPQFQLIIILRSVAVEGLVANSKNQKDTTLVLGFLWHPCRRCSPSPNSYYILLNAIWTMFSFWEVETKGIELVLVKSSWQQKVSCLRCVGSVESFCSLSAM